MASLTLGISHGMVFILDPYNPDFIVPEYIKNALVASTDSCTSIAVQPEVDGDVEISMLCSGEIPPDLVHVGSASVALPSGKIAVTTADSGSLIEYDVPGDHASVSIYVDDVKFPARVFINVHIDTGWAHARSH